MTWKRIIWFLSALIGTSLVFLPAALADVSLQEVYDAAGPGQGYDKLLELDPEETYTGNLLICQWNTVCIHGNGALVVTPDPELGIAIRVLWSQLDIDHAVIVCGYGGIEYGLDAYGVVKNNTIVGATENGIRTGLVPGGQPMEFTNNIISHNKYGVYVLEVALPTFVAYNDLWDNRSGHYVKFCEG
jgi:hypothetical protein